MTSNGRAVFHTLDPELSRRLRELSRGTPQHPVHDPARRVRGDAAPGHRPDGHRRRHPDLGPARAGREPARVLRNTLALRSTCPAIPPSARCSTACAPSPSTRTTTRACPSRRSCANSPRPARWTGRRCSRRSPSTSAPSRSASTCPASRPPDGRGAGQVDLTDLTVYFTDQPPGRSLPSGVQHRPVRPRDRRAGSSPPSGTCSRRRSTPRRHRCPGSHGDVDAAADGDPVPLAWQRGPSRPLARHHRPRARRPAGGRRCRTAPR